MHKHHRYGPTCPFGGFHQIGRKYIRTRLDRYPVYERRCAKCGTTWTRWPDELTVRRGPVPLHYTTLTWR